MAHINYGDSDSMWVDVQMLIELTGRTQPSLHRSLKELLDNGLIIRRARKRELFSGGLPKRYFDYMDVTNKYKQDELERLALIKHQEDESEAKALGISVFDYQISKLFK